MSTATLTKLWTATFTDGHVIQQHMDDRSINHDDASEHNPSAFKDVIDYPGELSHFSLGEWCIDIQTGIFHSGNVAFSLEEHPLTNRNIVYFRQIRSKLVDGELKDPEIYRYVLGYAGKDETGHVHTKVIYIDA